jgi:hypothetical protein
MYGFPNILFPGAGGNWQTIDTRLFSPNVSVSFAGNPAVEREVSEDVASYGRQIGWLNDIVTALVEIEGSDALAHHAAATESLKKLKTAKKRIDEIKKRREGDAFETARGALVNLGVTDRDAYRRLVRSLDANEPPTPA